MKRTLLFAFLTLLGFTALHAQMSLDELRQQISNENRITGSVVKPEELNGRVVIVWNISQRANEMVQNIEQYEENTDSDNSWKPSTKEYSAYRGMEDDVDELKRILKTTLRDGRVFVVTVADIPDVKSERRRYTRAIRRMSVPFTVFDAELGSLVMNAAGQQAFTFGGIGELKGNSEFIKVLKETPPYVPGRILTYRTPLHEQQGKALVEGRNITAVYTALKKEAADTSTEKGQEAAKMVASIDSFVSNRKAEIDSCLANSPSLAGEKINLFAKTCPGLAKGYQAKLKRLQRAPEVSKLAIVRRFLEEVNSGKYGEADIVRYAKANLRTIKPFLTHKNSAIAAEANTLKPILESLAEEEDDSF